MRPTVIQFYVTGTPKGQPRPRAFVFRGQARVYNPSQAESWKSEIAIAAKPHAPKQPLTGPIALELTFYFARPKSHFGTGKNADRLKEDAPKFHTCKPDRDNSDKAVMDCLSVLRFWGDDCQVCDGYIKKLYCPVGMQPGCRIVIVQLETPQDDERQPEMFTPAEEKGLFSL